MSHICNICVHICNILSYVLLWMIHGCADSSRCPLAMAVGGLYQATHSNVREPHFQSGSRIAAPPLIVIYSDRSAGSLSEPVSNRSSYSNALDHLQLFSRNRPSTVVPPVHAVGLQNQTSRLCAHTHEHRDASFRA